LLLKSDNAVYSAQVKKGWSSAPVRASRVLGFPESFRWVVPDGTLGPTGRYRYSTPYTGSGEERRAVMMTPLDTLECHAAVHESDVRKWQVAVDEKGREVLLTYSNSGALRLWDVEHTTLIAEGRYEAPSRVMGACLLGAHIVLFCDGDQDTHL